MTTGRFPPGPWQRIYTLHGILWTWTLTWNGSTYFNGDWNPKGSSRWATVWRVS